ncbi:MAG: exodeoxyribonuclease VII large subunit [Chromatiales bacterium]|nr:exodeoxyribonuclease VII large subunit [Chromatiales bacterium]
MTEARPQITIATAEPYSVSRLNREARLLIERGLGSVAVEAEISGFKRAASGHLYFSLKDDLAQLRCAMFRMRSASLAFEPRDGMQVLARGRISIYEARGEYQLVVDSLEAGGEGLLRARFDQLRARLEAEGLFAQARKRALPEFPRQLGVITSPAGAALHDVLSVLRRRYPALNVLVFPAAVQGDAAPRELIDALELANRREECDLLLLTRGGGSLEDLWAFNDEALARAIAASRIPVVAAIGHEVDFTIADLVADVRGATPSAAAELLSPDGPALISRHRRDRARLQRALRQLTDGRRTTADHLSRRLANAGPRRTLQDGLQRTDDLELRIRRAWISEFTRRRQGLQGMTQRLARVDPRRQQLRSRERLHALRRRLKAVARGGLASRQTAAVQLVDRLGRRSPGSRLELAVRSVEQLHLRARRVFDAVHARRHERLAAAARALHAASPIALLGRGYTLTFAADGSALASSATLAPGDRITTRWTDGRVVSRVIGHLSDDHPDGDIK